MEPLEFITPEYIMVTFTVNVENNILLGKMDESKYELIGVTDARTRCRQIVANALERFNRNTQRKR